MFTRQFPGVLDANEPLLVAVQYQSTAEFMSDVKERDDTELFEVSEATRDELPDRLVYWSTES